MLPVTVARSSSDDRAICYVLPVFIWRHFFHLQKNKPESKTTHISSSSPGGGTGAKSSVSVIICTLT